MKRSTIAVLAACAAACIVISLAIRVGFPDTEDAGQTSGPASPTSTDGAGKADPEDRRKTQLRNSVRSFVSAYFGRKPGDNTKVVRRALEGRVTKRFETAYFTASKREDFTLYPTESRLDVEAVLDTISGDFDISAGWAEQYAALGITHYDSRDRIASYERYERHQLRIRLIYLDRWLVDDISWT